MVHFNTRKVLLCANKQKGANLGRYSKLILFLKSQPSNFKKKKKKLINRIFHVLGCRMPGGVKSPEEFWDVLVNERDMIGEIPPDRWSIESWYDPDQTNHTMMVTKRCGFIHDIDKFDNTFFKVCN